MQDIKSSDFLSQLSAVVEKNISNEQFGVSELAEEMSMSRSNLLRKVKKETNLSVSQLISQVRLQRGMELLKTTSLNVSEVSHQVGFSSTSYFIKCFREFFGYPPGEVGKREAEQKGAVSAPQLNEVPIFTSPVSDVSEPIKPKGIRSRLLVAAVAGAAVLVIAVFAFYSRPSVSAASIEKSIAVLPFKNESSDSTNLYLINGLMESTLNNLQQIKELKVISRTSMEKYRRSAKSIPEMARELNVKYFVEGSGQKIGDRILLNIQLIDGATDRHLWATQYRREAKDIFELQEEIAKSIADEIQVIITPEEEKRIEKKPTDDLLAYDNYLKGKDLFYKSKTKDLIASIPYFEKAIEYDNKFALAYANAVMVFYYLDIFHVEKKYTEQINNYADKAMLFDAKLGESLIAKALSYAAKKEYPSAIPYFEQALEYNPNSGLVLHFLTEFYYIHVPNTAKYLEYSLRKVKLDEAPTDSATKSHNCMQLANAFVQAGFFDEALVYVNKSLDYNPKSTFAGSLKVFILYVQNNDLQQARDLLIKELQKDTTRFDLIQELGKICFIQRDYDDAYRYYKKFIDLRERSKLDLFRSENLRIGLVLAKMGLHEKSKAMIQDFKDYAEHERSIYKHLNLAVYYSTQGDSKKAIEHLQLFSKEDNFLYLVLLLDRDPIVDAIKDLPEFKKIMRDIENKFWATNKMLRVKLQEKRLL